jgi:hypothetical protein
LRSFSTRYTCTGVWAETSSAVVSALSIRGGSCCGVGPPVDPCRGCSGRVI